MRRLGALATMPYESLDPLAKQVLETADELFFPGALALVLSGGEQQADVFFAALMNLQVEVLHLRGEAKRGWSWADACTDVPNFAKALLQLHRLLVADSILPDPTPAGGDGAWPELEAVSKVLLNARVDSALTLIAVQGRASPIRRALAARLPDWKGFASFAPDAVKGFPYRSQQAETLDLLFAGTPRHPWPLSYEEAAAQSVWLPCKKDGLRGVTVPVVERTRATAPCHPGCTLPNVGLMRTRTCRLRTDLKKLLAGGLSTSAHAGAHGGN